MEKKLLFLKICYTNQMAAVENLIKMRIKCICWQWYPFSYSWVIISYYKGAYAWHVFDFVSTWLTVVVAQFSILNGVTK